MKHQVKSMYVLRDCCGAVKACSKKPIPYEASICPKCGDSAFKLYKVTYVRDTIRELYLAEWADLEGLGIEYDVIKQLDESKVDVYILPMFYDFVEDDLDDRIYGERV